MRAFLLVTMGLSVAFTFLGGALTAVHPPIGLAVAALGAGWLGIIYGYLLRLLRPPHA